MSRRDRSRERERAYGLGDRLAKQYLAAGGPRVATVRWADFERYSGIRAELPLDAQLFNAAVRHASQRIANAAKEGPHP